MIPPVIGRLFSTLPAAAIPVGVAFLFWAPAEIFVLLDGVTPVPQVILGVLGSLGAIGLTLVVAASLEDDLRATSIPDPGVAPQGARAVRRNAADEARKIGECAAV